MPLTPEEVVMSATLIRKKDDELLLQFLKKLKNENKLDPNLIFPTTLIDIDLMGLAGRALLEVLMHDNLTNSLIFFLNEDANLNITTLDYEHSPLFLAHMHNWTNLIKLLYAFGADFNKQDTQRLHKEWQEYWLEKKSMIETIKKDMIKKLSDLNIEFADEPLKNNPPILEVEVAETSENNSQNNPPKMCN